ncbi:hypothetical protein QQ056_09785 [Oscillatoria laete-virens NRMC-F 0139]|jgi:hypothetical protein|nr:hypothetical protein [Oscillatoria laete-virens]MDL5053834.1 hypothetical protein [Oscillatoria laete-virens NRMC-F 0139]
MATDSRSWFYTTPQPRPYFIEERVNHTLWKHRLANIHMVCTHAEVPIRMEGRWQNELPVEFEWQPGKYFILRTGDESKEIIGVMRQILMMRPVLMYQDNEGMYVTEWHTDGGEARWRELQGQPAYQGLKRLRR